MLSIMFAENREWWVSGPVFERLFDAAMNEGFMPERLERWRHETDANGGIYLPDRPADDARTFIGALSRAARSELKKFADVDLDTQDGTYVVSLQKLLVALEQDSSQDPLRCEGGQACPRTGYWLTPARLGSRQRFEQGELMPALDTDYGVTIWQWDEQQ